MEQWRAGRRAGRQTVGDMQVSTEQHRGTGFCCMKALLAFNHEISCRVPYTRGSNSCFDVPEGDLTSENKVLSSFHEIRCRSYFYKKIRLIVKSVGVGLLTVKFYVKSVMNFCPYFPYF
jgi:hypothetical protein